MNEPSRTQRLGAYAVVLRGDEILLTRISPQGYPAGTWTLPGGGVDHGESPHDAVVRELYEEAGLRALRARLVDVHDIHIVELGRDDRFEDYHGVHLLYAVEIEPGTEPHVVEIGGTTDVAQWVPISDIGSVVGPVLPMVEHVLASQDHFAAGL